MGWFSKLFTNNTLQSSDTDASEQPKFSAADLCAKGEKFFDSGKFVEAMECFQAAIDANKQFEKSYLLLSTAYEKQGKKDKAKSALYALLAVYPDNENALKRIDALNGNTTVIPSKNKPLTNTSLDNTNNVNKIPQSQRIGDYRVFRGTPDDAFDFYTINDDGNRLYFKIAKSNCKELQVIAPIAPHSSIECHNWDGYKKPQGLLDIPSAIEYNGEKYVVTSIGVWAFYDCDMRSVIIPDTITSIEANAFKQCSLLRSIHLPSNLHFIGKCCFNGSAFDQIEIPDTVQYLRGSAFAYCKNLISFKFPKGISKIESGVLYGCDKLLKIVVPDNVKEIEDGAFGYDLIAYRSESMELIMESVVPPKICSEMFKKDHLLRSNLDKIKVVVPKGSIESYNLAQYWQLFDIQEET